MRLNEILESLMVEKGVTPDDVARNTGISRTTIYNIKNGHTKRPNNETIKALADYFGVNPKTFLVRESDSDEIETLKREVDDLKEIAAELQGQLRNAGPSLNKITLSPYDEERLLRKYSTGNGVLAIHTRLDRLTDKERGVILRILYVLDEVIKRVEMEDHAKGEPAK